MSDKNEEDSLHSSDESDDDEPGTVNENKCRYCRQIFKRKSRIPKHEKECKTRISEKTQIITNDDGNVRFLCEICCNSYKSLRTLAKHKLKHEPPGGFICIYCSEQFCMQEDLTKHTEDTHMVYRCRICKTSFNTKEPYLEHIMNVHNGQDRDYIVCENCGGQFKTNSLLRLHTQSNCGTTKPFKCDECNSYFRNQWSLKTHKLIHEGEKKFCCTYCGKKFLVKGQLKNHERQHTQEKPFVCKVCNKSFAHSESLVTHTSVHTGIKPYLCECCGARFSCVSNILQHRRRRPDTCGLPQYCKQLSKAAPRPKAKLKTAAVIKKPTKIVDDLQKVGVKIAKNRNKLEDFEPLFEDEAPIEIKSIEEISLKPASENFESEIPIEFEVKEQILKPPTPVKFNIETLPPSVQMESTFDNYEPIIQIKKEKEEEDSDELNDGDTTNFFNYPSGKLENEIKDEVEIKTEINSEINVDVKIEVNDFEEIKMLDSISVAVTKINKETEDDDDDDDGGESKSENDDIPLSKLKISNKLKNNKKTKKLRKVLKESKEQKSSKIIQLDFNNHDPFGVVIKSKGKLKKTLISEEPIECKHCPKVFHMRKHYIKHSLKFHGINLNYSNENYSNKDLKCKYCGKQYYMKKALVKHEPCHGPNGTLIHKCVYCKKYFESRQILDEHMKIEHVDKLKCDICQKMFTRAETLRLHKKRKHEKIKKIKSKTFVCQKCGKSCSSRLILNDHERSDCGQNPLYGCDFCGKKYRTAGTLKTHRNIHTKEVLFNCSYCKKPFQTKSAVKRHERQHTGEKPFKCEYCEKAFPYVESLLTHVALHTGVKRFVCNGCGERFSCISNLQNHRRTHADTCGKLPLHSKAMTSMGFTGGTLYIGQKNEN